MSAYTIVFMRWSAVLTLVLVVISSAACGSGEPRATERGKPSVPSNPSATPEPAPPLASERSTAIEQPPSPAASPSAAIEPAMIGPGPMRFEPMLAGDGKLPHDIRGQLGPDDDTMAYHLTKFGWTADAKTFIACGDSGSEEPGPCSVVERGQAARTLSAEDPGCAKLHRTPVDEGPTQWRYGNEITFTWSASVGADRVSMQFGGQLASGKGKADVLTWSFDPQVFVDAQVYPEVVSVSPDGERLAVVGHASLGEIDDDWTIRTIDVDEFAVQVYTRVAFDHFERHEYAEAEPLFARASEIDQHWKHPYNLACVRARAGKGDVEAALKLAVERGGDAVIEKARKDPDLDSVRGQAWFIALLET